MPSARPSAARTVVLVEGPSDAAALRVLLAARGPAMPGPVDVVDMGGVTNVGRHLQQLSASREPVRIAGLCDAAEVRFVVRALQRQGAAVDTLEDLARLGFFVCDPDLEGEFIRALGAPAVAAVLDDLGDGRRFRMFRSQRYWRGRDLADQVHRFAGSGSGRKVRLAEHLAGRLTPRTTPAPLAAVLAYLERPVGARSAAG